MKQQLKELCVFIYGAALAVGYVLVSVGAILAIFKGIGVLWGFFFC